MLVVAAQRTGWQLDEMEFDSVTFRHHMKTTQKKALYAHLNQSQSEEVRTLLNQIGRKIGQPYIEHEMDVRNNTIVVGPNFIVTLRANETSVEYLEAVLDTSKFAKSCHMCCAPSRYINAADTKQCMKCVSLICRACLACLIDDRVARFTDKSTLRRMTNEELDDTFCPRCPCCDSRRLGDLPLIRAQIIHKAQLSSMLKK